MGQPVIRFVSGPSLDADVRLDLHNMGTSWTLSDEWDLGAPEYLGAPDAEGGMFGFRRIEFRLYVGTEKTAALRLMRDLARELGRPRNWLQFQLGHADPPVWFELFRNSPDALDMRWMRPEDSDQYVYAINVGLNAAGHALGELEEHEVTLTNTPDGAFVELPEVKGDAAAPLSITLDCSDDADLDPRPVAGVLSLSALRSWRGVQWWPSTDGQLSSPQQRATVTSAVAEGGSYLQITSIPAAWGDTYRLRAHPAQAGRWRILASMRHTNPGTIEVRGGGYALAQAAPAATVRSQSYFSLVDLGTYALPWGNTPQTDDYTVARPSGYPIAIEARRTSGTATLDLDWLVAVPVDLYESMAQHTLSLRGPLSATSVTVDGEAERLRVGDESALTNVGIGVTDTDERLYVTGGFPMAHPGAVNVLAFLRGTHPADTRGVRYTDETKVRVTYHPRWTWLAAD